ncbi:unnamed protein product [Adineta ricciae]|uniref:Gamma-glutamylcyclotransferase AIG2-like domain-containing protein n=1 Tax=Adineta ricciae TaxID=249248 RepID=A0A814P4S0_ADIRI|nr:unnamed protein product [Adineta ricciae]CAF1607208.1 unnamed protein product [Adineta ricciae]
MSTDLKQPSAIELLATYGTLRDDNDTNAPWAKNFTNDMSYAITGKLTGYQLFAHSSLTYPFAIYTGNSSDSIVVRLLGWPSREQFAQKITQADLIEGDDYERKIVEVLVNDNEIKHAYIYVPKLKVPDQSWIRIPSGDWLQRPSK